MQEHADPWRRGLGQRGCYGDGLFHRRGGAGQIVQQPQQLSVFELQVEVRLALLSMGPRRQPLGALDHNQRRSPIRIVKTDLIPAILFAGRIVGCAVVVGVVENRSRRGLPRLVGRHAQHRAVTEFDDDLHQRHRLLQLRP